MTNIEKKVHELETAKKNVAWLLKHDGLVDMHGIVYWAGRVEAARQAINEGI